MGEERDFTIEDQLIRILSSNADEEECPIQRALELLGGKWRTHIIYELCIKPCRFGELKKAIPKITLLPVAPLFAEAIERIYEDKPVSTMYTF